ncbi:MAG: hypothetical protein KatS3mg114_0659 [Planctomycetaceae bacterium]|nr:MAG: hypothetical protein KatS3mg114_0659 [Planctomycetaceae bacterium]
MSSRWGLASLWFFCWGTWGWCQITVQQPVITSFGMRTSVSVPDRGHAVVGGTSSLQMGRQRQGFGPNSALGYEARRSQVHVSVFIHDLRAMDEALLAEGAALQARISGGDEVGRGMRSRGGPTLSRRADLGSASQGWADEPRGSRHTATEWEQRAQQAEARGKHNVAEMYRRLAEKARRQP